MYKDNPIESIPLVPGQIIPGGSELIELNASREPITIVVSNVGDRRSRWVLIFIFMR